MPGARPVRIANCSGFFGDRLSAAREMVEGGPIDVLTGDWLAELTMLILWKAKARNADGGYASTFLTQMEQVLGTCADRGIKVVTNAGGLNPGRVCRPGARHRRQARRVRQRRPRRGRRSDGSHRRAATPPVQPRHRRRAHRRPGQRQRVPRRVGHRRALAEGADVVVCPRVTDAALVVGPAAWWWGWGPTDWDRLAGAVMAGHVIECGAQTTGGNFAFFEELGDLRTPLGFPIAEVDHDGSTVITKHPGTGGRVTVDTVTGQLLYEIQTPAYANPDVITRFDTIRLADVGEDRVRISGVRGEPAPPTAKVAINYEGGYRNKMTFVLTGLAQERKAAWVTDALVTAMGGAQRLADTGIAMETRFVPAPPDAADQERSSGLLHVFVRAPDERLVGRAFSSAAVELALASYPGYFTTTPPGAASAFGVYWPALVPTEELDHTVVLADGTRLRIDAPPTGPASSEPIEPPTIDAAPLTIEPGTPLGTWFGARSGDKGGNANVGIWGRDDAGYAWLVANLTPDVIRRLIPEAADLEVVVHRLPNLRALNIVLVGYLGEGVASSTSFDPQAKGLGEYLRSRSL